MKIKYVLIAFVLLLIADTLNNKLNMNYELLSAVENIIEILIAICLILLIYLIIRRIIAKIKGKKNS